MMQPEELTVYHLVTPLSKPYVLPFGVLQQFNSFVAFAQGANHWWGIGESTPLPGYSHETAELLDREFEKLEGNKDVHRFLADNVDNPFVTSAILSSLDGPLPEAAGPVRICPILQWNSLNEMPHALELLAQQGNRVVKIKVGPHLKASLEVVRLAEAEGRKQGLRFRYDANQTFSEADAHAFIQQLDPDRTELVEQPFPPHAWDAMRALYLKSSVPLMLDESIVDESSIERAASCAHLIKLKTAKNGSPSKMLQLIHRARDCNLDVIVGNGAQGSIGCWLEGKVQLIAGLDRCGEMNGYRKIQKNPLDFLFSDTSFGFGIPDSFSLPRLKKTLEEHSQRIYRIY